MSEIGLDLGDEKKPGHRRHHKRKGRPLGCFAVLLALVVLLGGGYLVSAVGLSALKEKLSPPPDYSGNGTGSVVIEVHSGDTASDIATTLASKGVVESAKAFTNEAKTNPKAVGIQVGFYDLRHKMSAKAAMAVLVNPANLMQSAVTVPEGLTVAQIVNLLAKKTDFSKADYLKALRTPSRLGLPSYAGGNVEGYLFPATYMVPPKSSATSVLTMMVTRGKQEAASLGLAAKARALGYSPHDVMVVASLVQAEARFDRDFPKVARVVYNRLRAHMPLQFDSTVHYATGKDGSVGTSQAARNSSSAYNTYKVTGLPPTPIAAPGEKAIDAALAPAAGPWLYFVTTNPDTGETKFATTYAEHQKNVAEFQKWCAQSDHC
ncbi:MAG: endolytic transglycosylase MltG [Nocardioides sp.]